MGYCGFHRYKLSDKVAKVMGRLPDEPLHPSQGDMIRSVQILCQVFFFDERRLLREHQLGESSNQAFFRCLLALRRFSPSPSGGSFTLGGRGWELLRQCDSVSPWQEHLASWEGLGCFSGAAPSSPGTSQGPVPKDT